MDSVETPESPGTGEVPGSGGQPMSPMQMSPDQSDDNSRLTDGEEFEQKGNADTNSKEGDNVKDLSENIDPDSEIKKTEDFVPMEEEEAGIAADEDSQPAELGEMDTLTGDLKTQTGQNRDIDISQDSVDENSTDLICANDQSQTDRDSVESDELSNENSGCIEKASDRRDELFDDDSDEGNKSVEMAEHQQGDDNTADSISNDALESNINLENIDKNNTVSETCKSIESEDVAKNQGESMEFIDNEPNDNEANETTETQENVNNISDDPVSDIKQDTSDSDVDNEELDLTMPLDKESTTSVSEKVCEEENTEDVSNSSSVSDGHMNAEEATERAEERDDETVKSLTFEEQQNNDGDLASVTEKAEPNEFSVKDDGNEKPSPVKELDDDGEIQEEKDNEDGEVPEKDDGEDAELPDDNTEENTQEGDSNENKVSEDKGAESGMEEVSEEEGEDFGEEEGKGTESGVEEVSEEEEGEEKAQSGVEEVSEEEDESGEEKGSEMEEVSSEEEEEEKEEKDEPEDKQDDNDQENTGKSRSVELKQNGEGISFDDSQKDDGTVVKEVLQDMTIKIDNTQDSDKVEVKESSAKRRASRDKKDKGDSSKSKSKSSSHKDIKDINERLKAQASYVEDVELDYDDIHYEGKEKHGSEQDEDSSSGSLSSDGELEEEEDCEEGEIREPGQKIYMKPTCRFFVRGHCTWGINCRFLHPGVNDKGNYQLIERPGFNKKPPPQFEEWEREERSPTPEPPPPPPEPKEETAWERGLRQAKELRKKALERREHETNFEHKKLNLSIEDNPEFDKENNIEMSRDKSPVKKSTYYDKYEALSDDEYYDQTPMRQHQRQLMEQSWLPGQYENFEVRWVSREPYPPHMHNDGYPPPGGRYPPQYSEHPRDRGGMQRRPTPRRYSRSPPPDANRYMRPPPQMRDPRMMPQRDRSPQRSRPPALSPAPHKLSQGSDNRVKADEWHDPWRRSNVNKGKSPPVKRSRSRGRQRSRRSYSYSTSYSSSSYSGSSRSRSRSSSFSSVSSRSSRSSSPSRSPAGRGQGGPGGPGGRGRRPPGPGGPQSRRFPQQPRPGDPGMRGQMHPPGRPGRSPDKRPGGPPMSPTKMMKGPGMGPGKGPMPGRMQAPRMQGPPGNMPGRGPPHGDRTQKPTPPQQKKFQMEVKTRGRPLNPSAFSKEKQKPGGRAGSSSSSRSRSRSRSSSSSSRSSYSSRSSRSFSRSSSRSSSGSPVSARGGYKNVGSKERQRPPGPDRGKTQDKPKPGPGRQDSGGPGRLNMKIGETSRPASVAQAKAIKDPLKVTGQKTNIKLTLIKQGERGTGEQAELSSRKRGSEPAHDVPPAKRAAVGPVSKQGEKPVKKGDKVPPVSPVKGPVRPLAVPGKPVAPGPAPAAAPVKKKSAVSRREELLKQLKAVEDAIAKKKKKMT